jgi:SAM-dependent methyltransferase
MEQLETLFVCTRCKGALARESVALVCRSCREHYPITGGIPILIPRDQRPLDGFDAAVEKAEFLSTIPGDFGRLVDAYYDHCVQRVGSDEVFEYCRQQNKARRVGELSDELAMISLALDMFGSVLPTIRRVVEFGSGWGFSLAAMARVRKQCPALQDAALCGFDIDPPILVVAQRLFADLGLDNVFVAVADARLPLPFPPKSVDLCYSNGVVEHILEQDALMQSLSAAMSDDSVLHFMIPNRYMIHPEPHYNIRLVGFVPRRYLKRYVSWRLGIGEQDVVHILSYSPKELAQLMGKHFPNDLLGAIPVRPRFQGRALRLVAENMLGLLAANGYHCVVRRTPTVNLYDGLRRGQLMLSEYPHGPHVKCARVYRHAA